jgi:hypothetical protein
VCELAGLITGALNAFSQVAFKSGKAGHSPRIADFPSAWSTIIFKVRFEVITALVMKIHLSEV